MNDVNFELDERQIEEVSGGFFLTGIVSKIFDCILPRRPVCPPPPPVCPPPRPPKC